MNKHKILIAVLVFSIILNLGFAASFIKEYVGVKQNESESVTGEGEVPNCNMLPWYRDKLGLSADQFEVFRLSQHRFRSEARLISEEMKMIRDSIFELSTQEKPDTIKIHTLAEELGFLHGELKIVSSRHFREMMGICDKEQRKELYDILFSLQNAENDMRCSIRKGPRHRGGKHQNGNMNNRR